MASARLCAMGHQPVRLIPIPGRHTRRSCARRPATAYGIMLGDGLACWDFDHVDLTSPPAKAVGAVAGCDLCGGFVQWTWVACVRGVVGVEFPACRCRVLFAFAVYSHDGKEVAEVTTVIRNQGTSLAVREKLAADGRPCCWRFRAARILSPRGWRCGIWASRSFPRICTMCPV